MWRRAQLKTGRGSRIRTYDLKYYVRAFVSFLETEYA